MERGLHLRHRGWRIRGHRNRGVRQLAVARIPLLRRAARGRARANLRADAAAALVGLADRARVSSRRTPAECAVHRCERDHRSDAERAENGWRHLRRQTLPSDGVPAWARPVEGQRRREAQDVERHLSLRGGAGRHLARPSARTDDYRHPRARARAVFHGHHDVNETTRHGSRWTKVTRVTRAAGDVGRRGPISCCSC